MNQERLALPVIETTITRAGLCFGGLAQRKESCGNLTRVGNVYFPYEWLSVMEKVCVY